ncbi:transcription factor TFIIIC subunit tfc4 [Zalaria obscura]|uniref:Transcription factor TFIIIC subunit tfc4 n=1 Tax=Zalaria obscura TaxID=2024903 RepID=A0ACC3SRY6_9PEZI
MDGEYNGSSYPDPIANYASPYPGYQPQDYGLQDDHAGSANDYAGQDVHMGGIDGGYYPQGPIVHEGYIPQAGMDSDDEDPELSDYRAVRAQFGLNFVLNEAEHRDDDNDSGVVYEDYGSQSPHPRTLDPGLDEELLALVDTANDPTADPDFSLSDDEAKSADSMSVDSDDALDEVLREASRGTRSRGRGRGRGRGRKGWKWAIKGTEHDPDLDKKAAKRGRGRPRGSQVPRGEGRRRGPQKGAMNAAEPDQAFKRLQALATGAYLNNDLEAAAEYAREAVKSNPEIFAAHSLLSEILMAEGKEQDSLTVLLAGAHTKRDPALWIHVAQRTLDLAGDKRTQSVLEQAIYCYMWAIKLDSTDFDSRVEKMSLLIEAGRHDRARVDSKMMIKMRPHDLDVLRQYAELCVMAGNKLELDRAKQAYEKAIDIYSRGRVFGPVASQWDNLFVYLDIVERADGPEAAILQLKRQSRWLLGRKEETYWERFEDDREYDFENEPRRTEVPEFKESPHSDQLEKYGNGLPIDLRIKLGILRLSLNVGAQSRMEALRHLEHLMQFREDVSEYYDMFREAANAFKGQRAFKDAIRFYEPLQDVQDVPGILDISYHMNLAECYEAVHRPMEAEACYKKVIEQDQQAVEPRIKLAKMYEVQERIAEARPLVDEVIKLGKTTALRRANLQVFQPPKTTAPAVKPPVQPGRRLTNKAIPKIAPAPTVSCEGADEDVTAEDGLIQNDEQVWVTGKASKPGRPRSIKPKEPGEKKPSAKAQAAFQTVHDQAQRIHANHFVLQTYRQGVDEGDEEAITQWMDAAGHMIEEFRSTKAFYPSRDRYIQFHGYQKRFRPALMSEMESMRKRLQDPEEETDDNPRDFEQDGDIPDDFHGIKFSEWLDIFCEYALLLARHGETEKCYTIAQAAYFANVFYHSKTASKQIHSVWLACALILNDEDKLCAVSRWFVSQWPHSSGPYQLFAAVNRIFPGPTNWFNAGPTQKFILRNVKALDFALLDPSARDRYTFTATERSSWTAANKKDPNPHKLQELDPAVLTLYGHIVAAATSWPSALNYYFRAFALRPQDPAINLCIAACYVQLAMKRQSENRHFQIAQGMAFLQRYADLRRADADADMDHDHGKPDLVGRQEAEFNCARLWHLLGLNHLAVPGYERCLALGDRIREERGRGAGEEGKEEVEEFTQEAAFALAGICAMNENESVARAITERWLVI